MYLSDPQRFAFIGESSLTFADARSQAGAIAGALRTAGLQPGDRVALATSHGAKFYACFAGCFLAGFPVAVIDASAGLLELASMVRKAAPAAIIADEGILRRLTDYSEGPLPDIAWRIAGMSDMGGVLARWSLARWNRTTRGWPSLDDIVSTKETAIGDGAIIAAGSVVRYNVPDGVLAAGNPAKTVRERPSPTVFGEPGEE